MNSRGKRGASGAALVELSLVATVMLIMLAGVIDLGRAANAYFQLRNAAYTAARIASRDNNLGDNTALRSLYDINTKVSTRIGDETESGSESHLPLHNRIVELLQRAAIREIDPSAIKIETALEDQIESNDLLAAMPGVSGLAACAGDVVFAGIEARYESLFGIKITLSAKRWLPFLYRRGDTMPEQCSIKAEPPLPIPVPEPIDPFEGNHS